MLVGTGTVTHQQGGAEGSASAKSRIWGGYDE